MELPETPGELIDHYIEQTEKKRDWLKTRLDKMPPGPDRVPEKEKINTMNKLIQDLYEIRKKYLPPRTLR